MPWLYYVQIILICNIISQGLGLYYMDHQDWYGKVSCGFLKLKIHQPYIYVHKNSLSIHKVHVKIAHFLLYKIHTIVHML